jgi:rhamnosyltransferase subunit B
MLIMPYSHDQPDNARRMKRLCVAKVIQKSKYTPDRVARKVRAILDNSEFADCAARVAEELSSEDGAKTACDALENLYEKTHVATQ